MKKNTFKLQATERGFNYLKFEDFYQNKCSIQKSSLATEDAIWIGIDDPNPKIMASQAKKLGVDTEQNTGWVKYPIPKEVLINTRMHLTQEQVIEMLPILIHFAETGDLEK